MVIFEHISGNCRRRLVLAGTAAMATSLLLTTKASADGIANILSPYNCLVYKKLHLFLLSSSWVNIILVLQKCRKITKLLLII